MVTWDLQSIRKELEFEKLDGFRKDDILKEPSLDFKSEGLKRWLSFLISATSSPSGSDSRLSTLGLLWAAHKPTSVVTQTKKTTTMESKAATWKLWADTTPCALATSHLAIVKPSLELFSRLVESCVTILCVCLCIYINVCILRRISQLRQSLLDTTDN